MLIRSLSLLGRHSTYICSFLFGLFLVWFVMNSLFNSPVDVNSTQPVLFMATQGDTFKSVAKRLEEQRVVRHGWVLELLPKFLKEDEQAKLAKFSYGEYSLSPSMKPKEILRKFITNDVVRYTFTIPEGSNVRDIVTKISDSGLAARQELEDLLIGQTRESSTLILELGLSTKSLEGYLFPDTYSFTKPITPSEIIKRMFQTTSKNITAEMRNRAAELTLSFHEILVLASIIEKETAAGDERPIISSVFHSRLRSGMPLQSDPTVIYGIIASGDVFDGNLTRAHLQKKTPYNTYLNTGLPPNPICNPGVESIKAALYPSDDAYVYFVAKNDGTGRHFFSKTYAEHQKAVELYQKGNAKVADSILAQEAPSDDLGLPDKRTVRSVNTTPTRSESSAKSSSSSSASSENSGGSIQDRDKFGKSSQKRISQLDPVRRRPVVVGDDDMEEILDRVGGGG